MVLFIHLHVDLRISPSLNQKLPILKKNNMDGAAAEQPTAVLRWVRYPHGTYAYWYGLQIAVPDHAVCICDFYVLKRTHDTVNIKKKKTTYVEIFQLV